MNTGIISSRYAKALLRLVDETGNGDAVYAQVLQILKEPDSMPGRLEPEISRLVTLLVTNNRISHVKFILHPVCPRDCPLYILVLDIGP